MAISVDQVLKKIGEFEKYHWMLLGIVGYTALAHSSFPIMIVSFITAEPDWICAPGYNSSVCNFTKPITLTSEHYKARCDMPREAWTYVDGFTSTVTEYDLVCENSLLQSIAQSCYWIGMLLGLITGGYLSDRLGRRPIFSCGVFLLTAATWIMVYPKVFMVFIICRVIIGFGSGFRNGIGFVLLAEFTTEKHRAKIGVSSFYFWVAGLMLLALTGYFVPHWRTFLLLTAVCGIPGLFCWWFLPESPRWLLLHGKEDKAKQRLAKVAKVNGYPFPEDDIEKPETPGQTGNFKHLFFSKKVGITTLISWDLWFATSLVYYGVSFGSVDLGGNRYLNFALSAVVEFPSNFAAIVAADRFGRKKTVITGLIIAFIASAISISIPSERSNQAYTGGRVFVAIVAKFFINLSFACVYIWSTELFPTFVRTMGVSTSSAAARLGSFSASYIIWLIRVHPMLPYGIMGLTCLQAAILGFFLPETKGRPTLETMEDMISRQAGERNPPLPADLQGQVIKNKHSDEDVLDTPL